MGGLGWDMAHLTRSTGWPAGLAAFAQRQRAHRGIDLRLKEFELELMRDGHDNVVVVRSIENVDLMGVHYRRLGHRVAPAVTLTDREYQRMRDLGIAIRARVGGHQRPQHPVRGRSRDGRLIVNEMNLRVSRSVMSKATGFPIAKIAAKLGHRLHPRRDRQRHHRGNAGSLRTHPGLRGGQGAAVRVRSSSRCRSHPDHHREIRR